ncbi:hypothetical protein [Halomonas elongata]|uniref:hypothetical protein n=1 Tax=Halomonas elongata TaxID=2746 RepID=UPI0023AF78EE|nr:hypothetical protein [Halomonas elongata]
MKTYSYILYQLSRPFAYMLIKHEDKHIYDWVIPTIVTVAISFFSFVFSVSLVSLVKYSVELTSFVNSLPGFFIAALAAVATFNRKDIDKEMDGPDPPTVSTRIGDENIPVPLTRRRFLCMLFSYLTIISIFISIYGVIPDAFGFIDNEKGILTAPPFSVSLYLLVFCFSFMQLVVSTMYGLYYLGDRVHY